MKDEQGPGGDDWPIAAALSPVPWRHGRGRVCEDGVRSSRLGAGALRRGVRAARAQGQSRTAEADPDGGGRSRRPRTRDRRCQFGRLHRGFLDSCPRRGARGGPRHRQRNACEAQRHSRASLRRRTGQPQADRRSSAAAEHPDRKRSKARGQAPPHRRDRLRAREEIFGALDRPRIQASRASTRTFGRPVRRGS